jgi:hypothetical protein
MMNVSHDWYQQALQDLKSRAGAAAQSCHIAEKAEMLLRSTGAQRRTAVRPSSYTACMGAFDKQTQEHIGNDIVFENGSQDEEFAHGLNASEKQDDRLYQVAAVIGERKVRKGGERMTQVLVLWEGYGIEHATWEPILNIPSEFVDRFKGDELPDPDFFDSDVEDDQGHVPQSQYGEVNEEACVRAFWRDRDPRRVKDSAPVAMEGNMGAPCTDNIRSQTSTFDQLQSSISAIRGESVALSAFPGASSANCSIRGIRVIDAAMSKSAPISVLLPSSMEASRSSISASPLKRSVQGSVPTGQEYKRMRLSLDGAASGGNDSRHEVPVSRCDWDIQNDLPLQSSGSPRLRQDEEECEIFEFDSALARINFLLQMHKPEEGAAPAESAKPTPAPARCIHDAEVAKAAAKDQEIAQSGREPDAPAAGAPTDAGQSKEKECIPIQPGCTTPRLRVDSVWKLP